MKKKFLRVLMSVALLTGVFCGSAIASVKTFAAPNPEPYILKDINPGASEGYANGSNPSGVVNVGGTLFFTAYNSSNGSELWKSDGTTNGTVMVKDIYPGTYESEGVVYPRSSEPANLFNYNGTLLFTAINSSNGSELWKSDGTANGTVMVKDIYPGIIPESLYPNSSSPHGFIILGGVVYFGAITSPGGSQLWKSDGTEAGTVVVSGESTGLESIGCSFAVIKDEIFFVGSEGYGVDDHGTQLWKSDGTEAGTTMIEIDGASLFAFNQNDTDLFTVLDDKLYYAVYNNDGFDLWQSDGTVTGTQMIKQGGLYDNDNGFNSRVYPYLTVVGNSIYFIADDGDGNVGLWKIDGSEDSPVLVKSVDIYMEEGVPYTDMISMGSTLFFTGSDNEHAVELWASDGTANGTALLKDINENGSSDAYFLGESSNIIYFSSNDGVHGYELWKSDGTAAGTVMIKDIYPGTFEEEGVEYLGSSYPFGFTLLDDAIYFSATDAEHGSELWAYELPDNTPPALVNLPGGPSPINITEGQTITTNPYTIQVKPTDNYEITKVEFYVDDILICTDYAADADGVYTCAWDTSLYHSNIRVIAYDDSGNQSIALNRNTNVDPSLYNRLPLTGITWWYYIILPLAGICFAIARRKFLS